MWRFDTRGRQRVVISLVCLASVLSFDLGSYDWSGLRALAHEPKERANPITYRDVHGVAFSRDGKKMAMGRGRFGVTVLDATTRKRIFDTATPNLASAVAFTPDGETLASCGRYHDVELLDATGNSRELDVLQTFGKVTSVEFTAGGRLLAMAGKKITVRNQWSSGLSVLFRNLLDTRGFCPLYWGSREPLLSSPSGGLEGVLSRREPIRARSTRMFPKSGHRSCK